MSLVTGLQLPAGQKVAGLLVLSGYLPASDRFRLTPGFEDIPILHCHGLADPVVLFLSVSSQIADLCSRFDTVGLRKLKQKLRDRLRTSSATPNLSREALVMN